MTSPQIGDLAHSYCPFTGERHPALVIGERMCPHNGRLLILLVTPKGEDPRIDESPIEFVGPFNTQVHLDPDLLSSTPHALEARVPRPFPFGPGTPGDPFADL